MSIRSPRRLTACLQALSLGPSTLSPAGDTVAERMKQRQSSSKNPAALMIIQRRLDEIKKKNKPAALRSPFSTPKGKRMATAVVSDARRDGVHQDEPVAKRKLFNKDAACSSASASIVDGFIEIKAASPRDAALLRARRRSPCRSFS